MSIDKTGDISSPWLTTEQAADYLGLAENTLRVWRHRGEGPRYHVLNRRLIRYHSDEIDTYVRGQS